MLSSGWLDEGYSQGSIRLVYKCYDIDSLGDSKSDRATYRVSKVTGSLGQKIIKTHKYPPLRIAIR